jgi:phospholipid/cholesterol/gamma-HCH transport system permease protein
MAVLQRHDEGLDSAAVPRPVDDDRSAGAPPRWAVGHDGRDVVLQLSGDWLVSADNMLAPADLAPIHAALSGVRRVRLEAAGLGAWDSALIAFVMSLESAPANTSRGLAIDPGGLPEAAQRLLALARTSDAPPVPALPPRTTPTERVGRWAIECGARLTAWAEAIGLLIFSVRPAMTGRGHTRRADVLALMRDSGAAALGIVAIANFLVGAILAFVGAIQLRRFGAEIYVANLIGVAVVREMAALMTAIVMAGRTGGAYAAQLATMQGNEEIDALRALGIRPDEYLVLPRVAALVAMMPVLYFYACFVGLLGGLTVSVLMLAISPEQFLDQLRLAVLPTEFYIGLAKSITFGAFIALAGCQIGLRAGRSADDVGHAATRAVVVSIIGIIALDAVFAACSDVIGI